jgi:hypothetical protein
VSNDREWRRTDTEANLEELSYDDFVRAHGLSPLNDIKTACRVANVGLTRFYELVADGVFVLIPNGSRRNVTAQNLHQYYLTLVAAARAGRAA